jgi:hypothetical protein
MNEASPPDPPPSSAELLWTVHRDVLGGRSSASGAPLPLTLAESPPGAQAAHHALACFEALRRGEPMPARPAFLDVVLAERAEGVALIQAQSFGPPRDPTPPPPPLTIGPPDDPEPPPPPPYAR